VAKWFDETERKFLKNADERDLTDEVGRNRAYFCLSMVRGLKRYLDFCASDGEDAQKQLKELIDGR